MLATNQYNIANWFMNAGVTVYIAIHRHATWWLIDYDAHEVSSYIQYLNQNTPGVKN